MQVPNKRIRTATLITIHERMVFYDEVEEMCRLLLNGRVELFTVD